jgi:simple sugar transport system ATP-binding protein
LAEDYLLRAVDVHKSFAAVKALRGVNLSLRKGEVVALLGDNGAGKSTFVKILSGYLKPDRGEIYLEGKRVRFKSPLDAKAAGIETIYQDLALIPDLSVYHNIFLGRERLSSVRLINDREMIEEANEVLDVLQIRIPDVRVKVESLSGGQRQAVAVARAVYFSAKLVIMDEPTAALSVVETKKVLSLIRKLAERGISVIVITHNIAQGYEAADRIAIMERGRIILEKEKKQTTVEEITEFMSDVATGKIKISED